MTEIAYELWEPVIGLEIHVQLNTRTKLFSPAPNRFGDEPNTNITEVDTGQPGSLPVLNREAVRKAIQFGLAIGAEISPISYFDRKSYFYPDSPRNFQITQFYSPLLVGGTVVCDVSGHTKHFSVHHSHIEDDTGMLKHFPTFAAVDYNRAGAALIEIVSQPCMHSPADATAYATTIKSIMHHLDASDCNMEEGSLRIDVNVSVRLKGEKGLRPKIEVKNLNSFHNMELAIEAEIRRQIRSYTLRPHEDPKTVIEAGTYRFDIEKKQTVLMRQKEEAQDYRYFPEPDLPPLVVKQEEIEMLKKSLPELPHQRYQRYLSAFHLSKDNAAMLIQDKFLADYFEEGIKVCNNPTSLCNWLLVEFTGRLKGRALSLQASKLPSEHVAKLVKMIDAGKITGKIAKMVADEMLDHPEKDPHEIVEKNPDYQPIHKISQLEPIVDQVLVEFPDSVRDFKAGNHRAFGFLVGQVMKRTDGKASPQIVNELLKKKML